MNDVPGFNKRSARQWNSKQDDKGSVGRFWTLYGFLAYCEQKKKWQIKVLYVLFWFYFYNLIYSIKQTDRQTDRQTDKQTNRQAGRQTDRIDLYQDEQ